MKKHIILAASLLLVPATQCISQEQLSGYAQKLSEHVSIKQIATVGMIAGLVWYCKKAYSSYQEFLKTQTPQESEAQDTCNILTDILGANHDSIQATATTFNSPDNLIQKLEAELKKLEEERLKHYPILGSFFKSEKETHLEQKLYHAREAQRGLALYQENVKQLQESRNASTL